MGKDDKKDEKPKKLTALEYLREVKNYDYVRYQLQREAPKKGK